MYQDIQQVTTWSQSVKRLEGIHELAGIVAGFAIPVARLKHLLLDVRNQRKVQLGAQLILWRAREVDEYLAEIQTENNMLPMG